MAQVNKALDALLAGLSVVAAKAHLVLGDATEEAIVKEATKLSLNAKIQHVDTSGGGVLGEDTKFYSLVLSLCIVHQMRLRIFPDQFLGHQQRTTS